MREQGGRVEGISKGIAVGLKAKQLLTLYPVFLTLYPYSYPQYNHLPTT